MSDLPNLEDLKIESLTVAAKYSVRGDFRSILQEIVDSIKRAVTTVLRDAGKAGILEAEIDTDGDVTFKFEDASFHFRLDVGQTFAGARFNDLYNHDLAKRILATYFTQLVQVLRLRDIDVFSVHLVNVFDLAKTSPKNYVLFEQVLMPPLRSQLVPLVSTQVVPARLDFKVGWDYDERRTCYLSIECPGNNENTTVWTTLNVRTRDDILVSVDQGQLLKDIDAIFNLYYDSYSATIHNLLSDYEIDLGRRQLREP